MKQGERHSPILGSQPNPMVSWMLLSTRCAPGSSPIGSVLKLGGGVKGEERQRYREYVEGAV